MVAVAQLVRASVCGTEGCGFKSHQPPQDIWADISAFLCNPKDELESINYFNCI